MKVLEEYAVYLLRCRLTEDILLENNYVYTCIVKEEEDLEKNQGSTTLIFLNADRTNMKYISPLSFQEDWEVVGFYGFDKPYEMVKSANN